MGIINKNMEYSKYKKYISMNLNESMKLINKDVSSILNKISHISDDKFSVSVLEIQNMLDKNFNFQFILHTMEESYLLNKIDRFKECLINIIKDDVMLKNIEICKDIYPNIPIAGNPVSNKDTYVELKKILIEFFNKSQNNKNFIISDYSICSESMFYFILEIDKDFYKNHIRELYVENDIGLSYNSFLEQVIDILFDKWREQIYYRLEYSTTKSIISDESIINLASQDMTVGRGLPSHYIYTYFSTLNYEGKPCRGKIAFVTRENKCEINEFVEFSEPIEFEEHEGRRIRKLLEITQDNYYLIVSKDSYQNKILGIGKIDNILPINIIEFLGHMKWRLLFNGKEIMKYDGLNMKLPDREYSVEYYNKNINEYFGIKNENNYLGEIIDKASLQKHGTMIIISKNAKKEASRLCDMGRGIRIEPINLVNNIEIINKLSSIDGAIIIDLNGICYGIGIIVDGKTKSKGNSSRGSRYNSAYAYAETQNSNNKNSCIVFVFSEDKTIDILN